MIEWHSFFFQGVKYIWNKAKILKFYSEIAYFYQILFFSNLSATSWSYIIQLFRSEFKQNVIKDTLKACFS